MKNELGIKLRSIRIQNNCTQLALAEYMGVTTAYISDIENGYRTTILDRRIKQIATKFSIPESVLQADICRAPISDIELLCKSFLSCKNTKRARESAVRVLSWLCRKKAENDFYVKEVEEAQTMVAHA